MSLHDREHRHLPVRPDLDQLKTQAKELLRAVRSGKAEALAEFNEFHPDPPAPSEARLADAQLALARSYSARSWPRLAEACQLVDAIWRDDLEAVRELVSRNPRLVHEDALVRKSNWGPPMSYAANLGRNAIVKMLAEMGASDFEHALERAALQSEVDTAELIYGLMGSPLPPESALSGAAYTLSAAGTEFALRIGVKAVDADGNRLAPVDLVLETDSRNPEAKHAILEMYAAHGVELPDTPVMALHRGRIDLLEEHIRRDPSVLHRTYTHEEIYPPELGCHDEINATQGTPLKGTTLLHLCVDYDELEIGTWLIAKGADVNARAAVDPAGFGGHTPLFCTVVSQPNFWMNYQHREQNAPFTELLLKHGADPAVRASLRKQLHPGYGPKYDVDRAYEYRNVTALEWGERFHAKVFVSEPAMSLIRAAVGSL
jgi:hypothetical protein